MSRYTNQQDAVAFQLKKLPCDRELKSKIYKRCMDNWISISNYSNRWTNLDSKIL